MLNLFNHLTEEDNRKILGYVNTFGIENDYIGNEIYLKPWAESKKKLFHLLGGNFIYKEPVVVPKNDKQMEEEIDVLLDHRFASVYYHLIDKVVKDKDFQCDTKMFSTSRAWEEIKAILYSNGNLKNNIILSLDSTIKIAYKDKKPLQIAPKAKTLKTIQKIIEYADADQETLDLFEDFRLKHSQILNDKNIHGNLCISIHPLDFMTMSDNASNWSSCMNWKNHGAYCVGSVEMMNSNNVVCAYIESNKAFSFDTSEGVEVWNNKKWRQLFYCTKEILLSGKPYPYENKELTIKVLDILKNLAQKNWNRTYEFGIEQYKDMVHFNTIGCMDNNRNWIYNKQTKKHNIILDTRGMYNDFFNDHYTPYYCYRNRVKKNTIISVSGKALCLCCGKPMVQASEYTDEYTHEDAYNERYTPTDALICEDCLSKRTCPNCDADDRKGYYKLYTVYNGDSVEKLCSRCITDKYKICSNCGELYKETLEHTNPNLRFIKVNDKEVLELDFDKAMHEPSQDNYYNWLSGYGSDRIHDSVKMCTICPHCVDKLDKEIEFTKIKFEKVYYASKEYTVSKEVFDTNSEIVRKYCSYDKAPSRQDILNSYLKQAEKQNLVIKTCN